MRLQVRRLIEFEEIRKNPIKDIVNDKLNLNVTSSDLNDKKMRVFKDFLKVWEERGGGVDAFGVVGLDTNLCTRCPAKPNVRRQIATTIHKSARAVVRRFDDVDPNGEDAHLREFAEEFHSIVEKMQLDDVGRGL